MILFSWTDVRTQKTRFVACESKAEYLRVTGLPRTQLAWASIHEHAEERTHQSDGANLALGDPGRVYEARPSGGWEAIGA